MKVIRKSNILAFILIIGFAFNFAHSELGFMTPEGDTFHYTHDYCQLTNAPSSINYHIDSRLAVQINPDSYAPLMCTIPVVPDVNSSTKYINLIPPHGISSSAPLNIINRILLI